MSLRSRMRYMNPYDIHKAIINEYVLRKPGDTTLFHRDSSKDRRDIDVLKEHHKFLWEDTGRELTWEEQFAKKYYDKLFKEYCIGDLSLYKENKIAMRWRTEKEVVSGKGQFICGHKRCSEEEDLRTWEVNFAYREDGEKKNALVKIRLCPECSRKLNYHSRKKEVKRLKQSKKKNIKSDARQDKHKSPADQPGPSLVTEGGQDTAATKVDSNESPWENVKPIEAKSRDEEMEDYLQDLLL